MAIQPGSKVKNERIKAGMSQIDLALKAKVGLSTVRLAERGIVSTATLNAISSALGVPFAQLREKTKLSDGLAVRVP